VLDSLGPDRIMRELHRLSAASDAPATALPAQPSLPHLIMPTHHDVRAGDVNIRRLHATLTAVADAGPRDFAELLLTPGIGARTVRSLAMVAEIVHGAPYRFADPARFSLAHCGKDRHPFPVPLTVYDQTIRVLKTAVAKARLGRDEELAALKRLDDQARRLEGRVAGPDFALVGDQERRGFAREWRPQRLPLGAAAPLSRLQLIAIVSRRARCGSRARPARGWPAYRYARYRVAPAHRGSR
jgi:uncharacterized protein